MGKIAKTFNRNAGNYDNFALIHEEIAQYMCNFMQVNGVNFENCKVCDLGSGTGVLTGKFLDNFQNFQLDCLDISPNSLAILRQKYPGVGAVLGDILSCNLTKYDALISSMALQWLGGDISVFINKIPIKTRCFFAIPVNNSLGNLRENMKKLGLIDTIMQFPDAEEIVQIAGEKFHTRHEVKIFGKSADIPSAIGHLRGIGAGYSPRKNSIHDVKKILASNIPTDLVYEVLFLQCEPKK